MLGGDLRAFHRVIFFFHRILLVLSFAPVRGTPFGYVLAPVSLGLPLGRFQLFGNRLFAFFPLVSFGRLLTLHPMGAGGQLLRGNIFFHRITAEIRIKPGQPLLFRGMVSVLPFSYYLGLGVHLPPNIQIFTGGPQLIILHFPIRQGLGIGDHPPRLERLTRHLLAGGVYIHVKRAVEIAFGIGADVDGALGGVVFVGFLVRGLFHLKHMIAPLIVLSPVVQIPFRHIRLVVVMAPKEVPVSVLLVELPCHIGVRSFRVFPQYEAALVVKQDRAANHIALIFFQNNTSLMCRHLWTLCPEVTG